MVHVITRGTRDSVEDEDGVAVHRLTPARPELPGDLGGIHGARFALRAARGEWRYRGAIADTLHRLVEKEGVEVIEAADHMAEPIRYRPERHPHVPFIVRMHTPLAMTERAEPTFPEVLRRVVRRIERRFVLSASHLTAPGATCARAFRREMALGNRPITVHPNPPTYPPVVRTSAEADPPIVLFVGRLQRMKGVHLLVKAMPLVLERMPNVRFVFVGDDHVPVRGFASTGPYLRSLLPDFLQDRIELVGRLPHEQLGAYYRSAAVCVFPSMFEAFGYTCLEAMTYGKAIIGSAAGGMVELLDGGAAGVLYQPPDVGELAAQLLRLLGDAELRKTLGVRAQRRVLERYRPEVVLDEIEAHYRRALRELAA